MAEVIDNIGSEAGYVYLEGLRVGVTFESALKALYAFQDYTLARAKAVKQFQRSGMH
ncbi:hypothetical protein Pcac1_g749 [Phytophthora cactorum]|uniref:Uncharacterized protein n=1 Tax=Phytophthora cactorum TaxID=29920 RepID=A0A8T1AZZ6_9STRA|nr:hypothetical protein Pcac1_g749 [Phytophthora cactorum]KAG2801421.1 hypothetical protein PC112_g20050 [Phytophthora cactorum]KAG2836485.1 hypothetical protein PC111_g5002 [Phytophthora cactorum]KAG2880789.1 hypothetical protein PC114_g21890 [Phytophthora cactorum]KAG2890500.1 hypothetical protein PC115_g19479 [Phytophthora cactorum]